MILDFIRDNLDGDSWEKMCDSCYRDRYQDQNFVKIPAEYMGDTGIEGFTSTGIVYQCYCPEKNYSNDDLYEHLRNKVTKDIAKLIDRDNAKRLKDIGVKIIKEWHFVIPEYKDKRIVEHLEKKRKEVVAAAHADPKTFSYIDPGIQLVPKIAEDFKVELVRLIRNPLVDIKLNAAVKSIQSLDWSTCPAEKIENIKRKLRAIMSADEQDASLKEMIAFWAEAYLKGIEIMRILQESCGTIYEDLYDLEQQYKRNVAIRSHMNPDHSLNYPIFMDILEKFEQSIKEQFECFSAPTIMELKIDLVSGWLADCSLQFKAE